MSDQLFFGIRINFWKVSLQVVSEACPVKAMAVSYDFAIRIELYGRKLRDADRLFHVPDNLI